MKKILILATGGTLAGVSLKDKKGEFKGYRAGVLDIEKILSSALKKRAKITCKQIANIDSCEADENLWFKLLSECEKGFKEFEGIIITHGSDTLEESSYFLSLTLKCKAPVVFTAAMKPSDRAGTDAFLNLENALNLALNCAYKGVFITLNDKIFHPAYTQKTHSLNLNAFESLEFGTLGVMVENKPYFFRELSKSELEPKFKLRKLDLERSQGLPRVDIVFCYADDKSEFLAKELIKLGAQALIIATFASGALKSSLQKCLKELEKRGVKIVLCTQAINSFVLSPCNTLNFLSARKARIYTALELFTQNTQRKFQRNLKQNHV